MLEDYDLEQSIIMVNGRFVDSTYVLEDNDIVTIRIIPGISFRSFFSGVKDKVSDAVGFVQDKISDFGSFVKGKVGDFVKWLIDFEEPEKQEVQEDLKENPTISGQKNQSAKNKPIPIILGETLFSPYIIGQPFTRVKFDNDGYGTKQEYHVLYLVGWNDLEITDLRWMYSNLATNYKSESDHSHAKVKNGRIEVDGTTFVKWSDKINIEIRESGEVGIYNQKVIQEDENNLQLMHPQGTSIEGGTLLPTERFSKSYPMRIEMEVGFNGIYKVNKENGKREATSVSCKFQYSFDEINWFDFTSVQGKGSSYSDGTFTFNECQNQTLRYLISKDFSYNEVRGMIEENAQGGLDPNFVYMRCWRTNEDPTDQYTNDKIYLMSTRTFCFDKEESKNSKMLVPQIPFNANYRDKVTRIGIVVEANDALKGNLDSFNVIARSRSPIWDGEKWGASDVSSNPASHAYLLYKHNGLGNYKYSDSKIDSVRLGELYDYCSQCGFECNTAIVNSIKFGDAMKQILDCGHAYAVPIDNKYSVFIDKPQSVPSVILNNHNILKEGLTNTKSFDELYDGLEITFNNKNLDYRQDTIRCMYDSSKAKDENAKLQKVTYPYLSTPQSVWRKGKYDLLKMKYRPEMWVRRTGLEGLLCSVGSLIEIQDDTILVGIGDGGCITSIKTDNENTKIYGFSIDGGIPISDLNKEYAVKIYKYSNSWEEPKTAVYKIIIRETGMHSYFEFDTPVSILEDVVPEVDDNVSFGEYGKETAKCICVNKKPVDQWKYDLTLVPYDENVYTYDTKDQSKWTEQLPDFDSKVTLPSTLVSVNEVPNSNVSLGDLISNSTELRHYTDAKVESAQLKGSPMYSAIIDASVIKILDDNSYSPSSINCDSYKTEFDDDGNPVQVGNVAGWTVTVNGSYDFDVENSKHVTIEINNVVNKIKSVYGLDDFRITNLKIVCHSENNTGVIWDEEFIPVLSSTSGYIFELENQYQVYECYSKIDGVEYPNGYIKQERSIYAIPHVYNGLEELVYGDQWVFGIIEQVPGFRISIESATRSFTGSLKITALEGTDMAENGTIKIPIFLRTSSTQDINIGYVDDNNIEVVIGYDKNGKEISIGYVESDEQSGVIILSFGYNKLVDTAVRLAKSETFIEDIANDNMVSVTEKKILVNSYEEIKNEYFNYSSSYNSLVSYTEYKRKYDDLSEYLDEILKDMTISTVIERDVFNEKFNSYYNSRNTLEKEITDNPTYTYVDSQSKLPSSPKYGDYILVGFNSTAFTKGLIYTYRGVSKGWQRDDDPDKMMVAMNDFAKFLNDSSSDDIPSVVFAKNLIAMNAVIQNLMTRTLTLEKNGLIQSQGFGSGQNGFQIKADGNATFRGGTFNKINSDDAMLTNASMRDASIERAIMDTASIDGMAYLGTVSFTRSTGVAGIQIYKSNNIKSIWGSNGNYELEFWNSVRGYAWENTGLDGLIPRTGLFPTIIIPNKIYKLYVKDAEYRLSEFSVTIKPIYRAATRSIEDRGYLYGAEIQFNESDLKDGESFSIPLLGVGENERYTPPF